MRRLVVVLSVALVAVAAAHAGEWDQRQIGPPVAPGDLVLARGAAGLAASTPTGIERGLYQPLRPALAVAVTSAGVFQGREAPVLMRWNLDGSDHGRLAYFLEGLHVTAMTGLPDGEIYVALSDDGFLHELYRFTPEGVAPLPVLVPDKVTAMDTDESGCTIIYATGKPMIGFVDFCARRRLPPLPVTASVSAVRIAPGGTLLAVTRTGVRILRLGGDGKVRQSYGARGVTGWSAIDLTSDGTGFWAASKAGRLYRFALASGAVTATIDSPPVAALAVVGAPRLALPQIATPAAPAHLALDGVPTLTGEGLSGVENPPAASPSPCSETSASTITFQSHGQTIGPYTGSYDASTDLAIGGEARAGATGWPGLPPRVLSGVHGTFSIDSEVGRVTGTIELPRAAASDIGSCAIFTGRSFPNSFIVPPVETFSGYFWNAYAPTLAYSAQIESNGKTYTDSGSAVLSADLFDIFRTSGQLAGAGKQYHASFSSSEVAVDDRFQSTATSVSHAAAVPLATPALRVVLRWRDARDSFKLANVRLAPTSKRSLAKTRPGKLRITKLRITVVRTRTSLNATVSNLRAGQLSFTVQPQRLSRATTVQTAVAGTRR